MSHSPLNISARDFDAYAPEKATSNAYARPRLEVKQRALAWARGVVARLAELGISVDVHGSDEHLSLRNKKRVDCQWVFFWRDAAARDELDRLLEQGRSISQEIDDPSPYTRHAFLALRVDVKSVEVCFAVHPEAKVDVDNLHARLDAAPLCDELMSALAGLPEEFLVGVGDDRVACASATPEAIRGMLDRAAAGQVPLWIGWSVSRETALTHAEILDDQLEDAIIALAPIYKLVAWSRDNDLVALDRRLEGAQQERARTHAEAEAQTERWKKEQDEARRRSLEQAKERSEEARRATGPATPWSAPMPASPRGAPPSSSASPRQPPSSGSPRQAPPSSSASPRQAPPSSSASPRLGPPAGRRPTLENLFSEKPKAPRAPAAESPRPAAPPRDQAAARPADPGGAEPPSPRSASTPLEKGARVRVRSGPFADKVGVISELDGRGSARVLLGLLSTRLDLADLEPALEGRERPALQSSHRRPLAPPTRKAR